MLIRDLASSKAWIVERMGKFHRILEPGLNILLPVVDRVKYVQSLKEIAIDVPKQGAITLDNVTLGIDGVLYLRILDPYLGELFKPGEGQDWNYSVMLFDIVNCIRSILRRRRPRVCHHAAGADDHAIGAGQDVAGQDLPRA